MLSLRQPFDPAQFNFTKINEEREAMFVMKKCGRNEEGRGRDLLIINVSPLEYSHCLLVPDIDGCRNQVLTESSIGLAIETVLLSASPNFHVGFNSLCAFASVNHLHWHCYYNQYLLRIQTVPLQPGGSSSFFYIREDDYPAVGWVFLLRSATYVCIKFNVLTSLLFKGVVEYVYYSYYTITHVA